MKTNLAQPSRRLLRRIFFALIAAPVFVALVAAPFAAAQAPDDDVWWPSEWGPDDERGAANLITPAKVLEAVSLIEEGRIYELGRVYEDGMPLVGNRHYSLTIPGLPTSGAAAEGGTVFNDELVSAEIGQVGTQFDGLGHIGVERDGDHIFYNGFRLSEFGTAYGLERLGIENVGVLFTRGVLIDVARYKGVDMLDESYVITVEDIEATLEMQGVSINEGDAVLFHTGWGQLWMVDNETYGGSPPGPGITAIRWLTDRRIVMTGGDTYPVEAVPGENPEDGIAGHEWLLVRNGVYNFENLDLSALAADGVYEFAFIFAPIKLKGATGSPGNPIAVR